MKKSNFAFWLALNPLVDVYKLLAIFWQKSSEYSNAMSMQKLLIFLQTLSPSICIENDKYWFYWVF